MKIIDDNSKKLHWWNRNYFFIVTIVVAAINIIIYASHPRHEWLYQIGDRYTSWSAVLSFDNLLCHFLSAFAHVDWQHVLLNMLCFVICGGWLERRKGSLAMLLLVPAMAMVAEAFVGANDMSLYSVGFSGANYGLYAYAIVDYIFLLFCRESRTLGNIISGAILMGLIYFAACFHDVGHVTFEWYPHDFMHNMGHYSAFLGGAIIGLAVQIAKLAALYGTKKRRDSDS